MKSLTTPWPGCGSRRTATPRWGGIRFMTAETEASASSTEAEVRAWPFLPFYSISVWNFNLLLHLTVKIHILELSHLFTCWLVFVLTILPMYFYNLLSFSPQVCWKRTISSGTLRPACSSAPTAIQYSARTAFSTASLQVGFQTQLSEHITSQSRIVHIILYPNGEYPNCQNVV